MVHYLLPFSLMRKLKGGMRFDISLCEMRNPASHIQSINLEPVGTVVSQGLHLKNPRKVGVSHEPGAKTQMSMAQWHQAQFIAQPWWLMVSFFRTKIC